MSVSSPGQDSACTLDAVCFAYANTDALCRISFAVASGDFFVITGPNGAGKTTLLSIMAGLRRPHGGRVVLPSGDPARLSRRETARNVALVPQPDGTRGMFASFSVGEVVAMGRAPHQGVLGLDRAGDARIVRRAMQATGVDHLARRGLEELSGGERQRVFIARALCQQPRLLLLDEPTASLDLRYKAEVLDLLEHLRREQGLTVVMVTHDLSLAGMYGRTLLVLEKGRVAALGGPEDVLRAEILEPVYGCRLFAGDTPWGGPVILPWPNRPGE